LKSTASGPEEPFVHIFLRDEASLEKCRVKADSSMCLREHEAVALLPGRAVLAGMQDGTKEDGVDLCRRERALRYGRACPDSAQLS
jgi:hypothetical protein